MKSQVEFSILKYDDPSLYNYVYYSVWCNGFSIGTSETEVGAKKIIREYKETMETGLPVLQGQRGRRV